MQRNELDRRKRTNESNNYKNIISRPDFQTDADLYRDIEETSDLLNSVYKGTELDLDHGDPTLDSNAEAHRSMRARFSQKEDERRKEFLGSQLHRRKLVRLQLAKEERVINDIILSKTLEPILGKLWTALAPNFAPKTQNFDNFFSLRVEKAGFLSIMILVQAGIFVADCKQVYLRKDFDLFLQKWKTLEHSMRSQFTYREFQQAVLSLVR